MPVTAVVFWVGFGLALAALLTAVMFHLRNTLAGRIDAQTILNEQRDLVGRVDYLQKQYGQLETHVIRGMTELHLKLDTAIGRPVTAASLMAEIHREDLETAERLLASVSELSEPQALALASTAAFCRPLVPYPHYQFDADWSNPDFAFQLRRRLWTTFRDRAWSSRLDYAWVNGLHLSLSLRNDTSKLLFVGGAIDPNEFAVLDKVLEPGMWIADVGANEGVYSIFAAGRVRDSGRVLAFEPSRREREAIERNRQRNGLSNVEVFDCALGERAGTASLKVAEPEHGGHNSLGGFSAHGSRGAGEETVPVRTLDEVLESMSAPRLDFVKVDIEGAEMRFFEGARNSIARYRPLLLIEVSDVSLREQGASADQLVSAIRKSGYRLFQFNPQTGLPETYPDGPPDFASHNALAVPAERELPAPVFSALPRIPA